MRKQEKKASTIRFHEGLKQIRRDAAGLDIGAREIWVDVGIENDSEPVQRFETFTADLNRMAQWLTQCGIKTVIMESTGVYWIPACQILEDRCIEVVLVNPRYAKNVSGRKSDVLDCQWLRTLHGYGLLAGSFRPGRGIASWRSYLRQRQMLIEYAAAHIQHMQKAMTPMNLQLHHVIADITGLTGMRIIRAIVAGERNCKKLAAMRHERMRMRPPLKRRLKAIIDPNIYLRLSKLWAPLIIIRSKSSSAISKLRNMSAAWRRSLSRAMT